MLVRRELRSAHSLLQHGRRHVRRVHGGHELRQRPPRLRYGDEHVCAVYDERPMRRCDALLRHCFQALCRVSGRPELWSFEPLRPRAARLRPRLRDERRLLRRQTRLRYGQVDLRRLHDEYRLRRRLGMRLRVQHLRAMSRQHGLCLGAEMCIGYAYLRHCLHDERHLPDRERLRYGEWNVRPVLVEHGLRNAQPIL